jgi:hypothetical protein
MEPAQTTVEMGQVAEARFKCQRTHGAIGKSRIGQHPAYPIKPPNRHEFGKRGSIAIEQHADVTWRNPMAVAEKL